jgi:hypothetical protein
MGGFGPGFARKRIDLADMGHSMLRPYMSRFWESA